MSTNQEPLILQDRRQAIVEAGLAVLRQHGYAGFSQPRVASLAGLRQSHITYYHPTRRDLLRAVSRVAVDRHLTALDTGLAGASTIPAAARALAALAVRKESTRVLMALAQAGDEESELRELFRELVDRFVRVLGVFLGRIEGVEPTEDTTRLLHALVVGSAVVHLAKDDVDDEQRTVTALITALGFIVRESRSATSVSTEC